MKGKYIVVEVIPDAIDPSKGNLVQLCALKIENLNLLDRFDYRIKQDKVINRDLVELCSFDSDDFTYLDSTDDILNSFKEWVGDYPLLIIDNLYTRNYLKDINNEKRSIFDILNVENNDMAIDNIMSKYHLEPSNYISDLLYEALIYESNNEK